MDFATSFVEYELDWLRRHYEHPDDHTQPTLARLTWVDSLQPRPNWEFIHNIDPEKALKCYTVGWVLGMTDDALTVAMSITAGKTWGDRQVSGVMTIPIRSLTRVELAE